MSAGSKKKCLYFIEDEFRQCHNPRRGGDGSIPLCTKHFDYVMACSPTSVTSSDVKRTKPCSAIVQVIDDGTRDDKLASLALKANSTIEVILLKPTVIKRFEPGKLVQKNPSVVVAHKTPSFDVKTGLASAPPSPFAVDTSALDKQIADLRQQLAQAKLKSQAEQQLIYKKLMTPLSLHEWSSQTI